MDFDVAVVAGSWVSEWPTVGSRAISALCSRSGLRVGTFGGESIHCRGVIPDSETGGIAVLEDAQKRVHQVTATAIVKVSRPALWCDPFPGWLNPRHIPLRTAKTLFEKGLLSPWPVVAILGTSDAALRFACRLIQDPRLVGIKVLCVGNQNSSLAHLGLRTTFLGLGGVLVRGEPSSLEPTPHAGKVLFKIRDAQGVRLIECGLVVSAWETPDSGRHVEYPAGSLLFELESNWEQLPELDPTGTGLERERGRQIASRIVKAISDQKGLSKDERETFDRVGRNARARIKRAQDMIDRPAMLEFDGKWLTPASRQMLADFSGSPKAAHLARPIVSIECVEPILCDRCQTICPENAIDVSLSARKANQVLDESKCISCGLCVAACPDLSITRIHEFEDRSSSKLVMSSNEKLGKGDFVTLFNRAGEPLTQARVTATGQEISLIKEPPSSANANLSGLVEVDCPTHLLKEARYLRRARAGLNTPDTDSYAESKAEWRDQGIWIFLDGERRLVRPDITVSEMLYSVGRERFADRMLCGDGSCGLCQLEVDGERQYACKVKVHAGMNVRAKNSESPVVLGSNQALCPCSGQESTNVETAWREHPRQSVEKVLRKTQIGCGRCHGSICMDAFRRMENVDKNWVDWRFPWAEWELPPSGG